MHIIILQNIVTFRINWNELKLPPDYKKYLVISENGYGKFDKNQTAAFEKIEIASNSFQEEELTGIIKDKILSTIGQGEEVRIITNDEYSIFLAARLKEIFGIKGTPSAVMEMFVNKLLMKQQVGKQLQIPKYIHFDPLSYKKDSARYVNEIVEELGFPIFAKPIDSAGSENVSLINDHKDLEAWLKVNQNHDNYELDEYINSDEMYHCDLAAVDGKIIASYVCKYSYPNAKFKDGKPLGSHPMNPDTEAFKKIQQFSIDALNCYPEIPDGVFHLELFADKGELVFLEVGARAAGGMIPQMYKGHLGVNLESLHFRINMGLVNEVNFDRSSNAVWIWFPRKEGIVKELFEPQIDSNFEIKWYLAAGDVLEPCESIRDIACSVFITNDNYDALMKDYFFLIENYKPFSLENNAKK